MNRKQSTLFQSWGNKSQDKTLVKSNTNTSEGNTKETAHGELFDDTVRQFACDDLDDEELAQILEQEENQTGIETSSRELDPCAGTSRQTAELGLQDGDDTDGILNISLGIEEQDIDHGTDRKHCLSQCNSSSSTEEVLSGFNFDAGQIWIYPTNYSIREYQFNIVRQALVKNTLVTLPTGLGKTFIASVVMYNFYRWYPEGKIVFMAPTKPLVAQQIEACYNIMGIPAGDTAEMTGSMNPTQRQRAWCDKRVFFLTPQVMTSDLARGTCTAQAVKCLVVDEAHKALGNHAYCQAVRDLIKYTRQFRVLALSATPGSDIKSVQKVISNLLISHIELRSEDSPDIKPYTHERIVDKIVVPLGEEILRIKAKYLLVLEMVLKRLIHQRVLYNREVNSLSKYIILKARDAFRQNPPESLPRAQYGIVEGDFALAMSLYHGYDLLQLHGLRSLFTYLDGIVNGTKAYGRTRAELTKNADFNDIMGILKEKFQPSNEGLAENRTVFLAGHPKIIKLQEVVLEHFRKFDAAGQATRVMIFSQYRDSVQEITTMLSEHQPLIKVMSFIGQSSMGKSSKGFTQKEQLKVMKAFRSGDYNTLVSTCVGEEGLDIGDVDLIVCFDAHKSPIRLVQRMGRTGRKRQGRIVMLVTQGREEQIYNQSQYTKRSIHRAIVKGCAKSLVFYPHNVRMIPAGLAPACHRMHITVQPAQHAGKKQKGEQSRNSARGRLTAGSTKGKSVAGNKCGISFEEFKELKSVGPPVPVKHFPEARMLSLQVDNQHADEREEEDSTQVNMAEWLPWQNTLQKTSLFGHSRRSKHLVDMMLFTVLMQALPEEEDNYGQEMAVYLDMDDVIDIKRPVSNDITQFIAPSKKKETFTVVSKEEETTHKKDGKKNVRQSDLTEKTAETSKVQQKRYEQIAENSDDSDSLPELAFSVSGNRHEETVFDAGDGAVDGDQNWGHFVSSKSDKPQEGEATLVMAEVRVDQGDSEKGNTLCQNQMVEDSQNSSGDEDQNASGFSFRIPSPPPIEDIPHLVSLLSLEELRDINVHDVHSWIEDDVPEVDEVESNIWLRPLRHLNLGREEPERQARFHDQLPQLGQFQVLRRPVTDSRMLAMTDTSSDLRKLADSQRMPAYYDDISGGSAERPSSTSVRSNQKPSEFGQGNSSASDSDHHISHNESLTGTDVKSLKQKSGGVYVPSTDETVRSAGHKLSEPKIFNPSHDAISSPLESTEIRLHMEKSSSRSEHETGEEVIIGKKQLVSENKSTEIIDTADDKPVHDASVSDSFFDQHFLADDDDFENVYSLSTSSSRQQREQEADLNNFDEPDTVLPIVKTKRSSVKMSVTPTVHTSATNSAGTGTESSDKNVSLLTFTEALSFVGNQSSANMSQTGVDYSENTAHNVSPGHTAGKRVDQSGKGGDMSAAQDEDAPNFDLGFDFDEDEDVIPPSPEAKMSASQVSDRSLSSRSVLGSKLSVSLGNVYKPDRSETSSNIMGAGNVDWDETLPDIIEEEEHENSSLHVRSGLLPGEVSGFGHNKAESLTDGASNQDAKITSSSPAQSARLSMSKAGKRTFAQNMMSNEELELSEYSHGPKMMKKTDHDDMHEAAGSSDSHQHSGLSPFSRTDVSADSGRKHKLSTQKLKLSTKGMGDSMSDTSFEKPMDFLPRFSLMIDDQDEIAHNLTSVKSPNSDKPVTGVYCSTPIHGKEGKRPISTTTQSKASVSRRISDFSLAFADGGESDLDFEESVVVRKKPAGKKPRHLDSSDDDDDSGSKDYTKKTKKESRERRKAKCGFIDDEAEQSGDVDESLEEEGEENMEMMEGSFINNDTQLSQASQVDMQAIYMESVRSSDAYMRQGLGRYRLQRNPVSAVDVYSQLPAEEEEESQYEHDSFCVGSDEEESSVNRSDERTMRKRSRGAKKKEGAKVKQVSGRKRVRQLADSSSEDDDDFDRLPQTQGASTMGKAAALKVLMSSSDENLDISARETSGSPVKKQRCEKDSGCDSENVVRGMLKTVSGSSESVGASHHAQKSHLLETIEELTDEGSPIVISNKKLIHSATPSTSKASYDERNDFSKSKRDERTSIAGDSRTVVTQKASVHVENVGEGQASTGLKTGDVDILPSTSGTSPVSSYNYTSIADRERGKTVIFVDSREISGAQDIVSALRLKHNMHVCTRKLAACDYILSNRMAVDRLYWSCFKNGSNRNKVVEKLRQMQSLYERCIVIVEKDRLKTGEDKAKRHQPHTRYVDSLIAQLTQSSIRLFFTQNQGDTARLLAQLATVESRKGESIKCPIYLSADKEQVVKFFLGIPHLTLPHALNLCFNFSSLHDFMRSSVNGIQTKGHMTFSRAAEVVKFVRLRYTQAYSS